ncbi:flagellar hook-basal body complex protein [Sphingosinicella sp.]|uniref:flagellar hook-basal body complex protein n=1 Tax=Sphingosinicella sp. TaxID=1917971 RepID=UPI0040378D30
MLGAIYVGLSGLTAYSRGLQQISNNVVNMNSLGFKATTVSFGNVAGLNGRSQDGSDGNRGHGVSLDASRRDFRQGELRQTERDLDLAVDGTGLLVLLNGSETLYTRTGSFEVDVDGYIVLAGTNYRLATLDGSGRPVSLSIDASRIDPPVETTRITLSDNLSSTATSFELADIHVYDALGGDHVWRAKFTRAADSAPGEWTVTVTEGTRTIGIRTLRFNAGVIDPTTAELLFEDEPAGLSVTLDLSRNVTSFSSGEVSTLRTAKVDGHATGAVSSVKVNDKGEIEIGYSNSRKVQLGSIALAGFRDPQALELRSGGLFANPAGVEAEYARSGDTRVGAVTSRRLEASNVDLAQQFGDLILIQRGFQASSQVISVSNDMIQQLFGIRGQG